MKKTEAKYLVTLFLLFECSLWKVIVSRKENLKLAHFQETPQEAPFELPENDPGKSWPEHGEIVFDNYQVSS
jgi:hypothetical protein